MRRNVWRALCWGRRFRLFLFYGFWNTIYFVNWDIEKASRKCYVAYQEFSLRLPKAFQCYLKQLTCSKDHLPLTFSLFHHLRWSLLLLRFVQILIQLLECLFLSLCNRLFCLHRPTILLHSRKELSILNNSKRVCKEYCWSDIYKRNWFYQLYVKRKLKTIPGSLRVLKVRGALGGLCGYHGNLQLSHFFGKNFVKVTVLLKKLLYSWFDEKYSLRVNL